MGIIFQELAFDYEKLVSCEISCHIKYACKPPLGNLLKSTVDRENFAVKIKP